MGFDIKGYLTKYTRIFAKHNEQKEWVIACSCDRRDQTGSGHLWVTVQKQVGFCFRCRERYSLVDIVLLVEGCSLVEAFEIVRAGESPRTKLQDMLDKLNPEVDSAKDDEPKYPELPKEYLPVTEKRYPTYLKARHVSLATCKRHHIGVCKSGFYKNRVIVPVYDLDGTLALFVARWEGTPPKGVQKVLYPKGSRTSKVLFNHRRALEFSTVVVTEGVFDAMRVGPRAVALFGKHATQHHIRLLAEIGVSRRLVIMLDPDAADDAEALADELAEVCGDVRIATLPAGRKDPGECSKQELKRAIARARRVGVVDRLSKALQALK